MGKELFEKRKLEFKQFVIKAKRLPKVWESKFKDKEDLRIWYDQISKISKFKSFIEEINEILTHYNVNILTNKEKEEQFLKCIEDLNRIPSKNEKTFSDNDDMYTWYIKYKTQNRDFETIVHESLEEYQEIQMSTIWPDVKEEFISIIKQLKRVPEHGEVILQNKIDARVIYDKLINHDPQFIERLLL